MIITDTDYPKEFFKPVKKENMPARIGLKVRFSWRTYKSLYDER